MLFATEGIESDEDLAKPMVGIASIWYVAFVLSRKSKKTWLIERTLTFVRAGTKAIRELEDEASTIQRVF